jgi:DNA repair exonuclease SbcCD ATPase subunit
MPRNDIFKQIKQLETLKRKAIKQLLSSKEKIEKELSALGHGASAAISTYKKIQRQRDPNKACKVCGETGHDARRHRFDKKGKKGHASA